VNVLWLMVMGWMGSAQAEPGWSDLSPWRTWAVLEHVQAPRHWFVAEGLSMTRQRCEIGLPVDGGRADVWCGPRTLGADRVMQTRGPLRKAHKAARDALVEALGASRKDVSLDELDYVGTLSRVTFRQVVPVGDGPGAGTPARTWATSWDVAADGAVHPSAVVPEVRVTAMCAPGVHKHCQDSPVLLPYVPPAGWDGRLVPVQGGGEAYAALARAVASATEADFAGAPLRSVGEAVLPAGFRDELVVTLQVQANAGSDQAGDGRFDVDVPLAEAAQGPVRLRMPVDGVPAAVELDVDLPSEQLTVRIRPDQGRYVEHALPIQCQLLVTEDATALPGQCSVDSRGRWLRWDGTAAAVMVQVAPDAGPKLAGAGSPGIRAHVD